jgi:signal transduction histidine kinase
MAATRRPARSRRIRLFLVSIFVIPLISLVALWAFAAILTVPGAITDHNYNVTSTAVTDPAVSTLTTGLPAEQQETYLWLLSGRRSDKSALLSTRAAITKVLPAAEATLLASGNTRSAASNADESALAAELGRIPSIRRAVDAGRATPAAAFQAYSDIIDAQFQAYYAETPDRGGGSLQAYAVGTVDTGVALEMVYREAALVNGALMVEGGHLDAGAERLFISSAVNRQFLMGQALSLLTSSLRDPYAGIINSPIYKQFETMEKLIMGTTAGAPLPVNGTTWSSTSGTLLGAMLAAETSDGNQLAALSGAASHGLLTEAILAGGVGLVAVVVSVALLVWFGRKVTRDLTELHTSVQRMAEERLPRVVEQLRRGDDVDVLAESPPPAASGIEEISQIARSFGSVQEAAVAAAVEQARLRKGVNQVFLNISMRNQSLLHRQLGMLDTMERRTSDPGALADLFRLDHLTTRMQRHAEGLIILSGSTPGRGWREPIPVIDVLRAAVAEVEDYVRVDVLSESRDMIAGSAVNDVIHLIAELVENAAVFSPPNTRIEVSADLAGTGLVVEIEDRGLGLTKDEIADINARLANPPEFNLEHSDQLGLFVVGRLAVRHAIQVALRRSVYGGTTAVVVLPFDVIVRDEEAGGLPGSRGDRSDSYDTGPFPASPFGVTGRHRQNGDPDTEGATLTDAPLTDASFTGTSVTGASAADPGAARTVRRVPAAAPTSGDSHLGMPIRVPQANLASQLRAHRDRDHSAQTAEPDTDERSLEATRNRLILMQQGWERGRVDDLDDPAGAPDNGTER